MAKMSLRERTAAARKDQEERKSGLPKIKPDTYQCMLIESKHGPSKKGDDQFVLNFKIIKGEETGRECANNKFNIYFQERFDWAIDNLLVLLEDLGVSMDWIDAQEDQTDAILQCLEAADGTKPITVFCKRSEKDEKRNNYYINEAPRVLNDEEFGVDGYTPEGVIDAEVVEEKKPKKKKKSKPEPEPEPEPEAAAAEEDWEDDWED
jgi:hypothetical protein